MADVRFDILKVGDKYTSKELAEMWNYKSYHALIKGVVTPKDSNYIILFVTKEKQIGATPYEDELRDNILYMTGQKEHGSDKRLASNLNNDIDEIYLFFRNIHHTPFVYYGRCYLLNVELNKDQASKFQFLVKDLYSSFEDDSLIIDYMANIPDGIESRNTLITEGVRKIAQHIRYERNPHNRSEAIRLQGHRCKICGFDFNQVYGEELASDYIEIHHIKQLAEGEQIVDPGKDLIPVCANCHRMLHRKREGNITIEELKMKERLKAYQRMFNELEQKIFEI